MRSTFTLSNTIPLPIPALSLGYVFIFCPDEIGIGKARLAMKRNATIVLIEKFGNIIVYLDASGYMVCCVSNELTSREISLLY
jgi:hypothetical protein